MKEKRRSMLAVCMVLQLLFVLLSPVAQAAAQENTTVTIHSVEDLLAFARNCSLDTWSQGKQVTLRSDLDLSDSGFTAIPSFGGNFDGGGHSISGLHLGGSGSHQGLFRYIQSGAVVHSLTVRGSVTPDGSREAIGGIAGNNAGTILDCSFQGTVKGKSCVGGIVGRNAFGGQVVNARTEGLVQGEDCTGGITGRNYGSIISSHNQSSVNTATPKEGASLENIDVETMLTTKETNTGQDEEVTLKGHSDTGGVAGHSSGLIQNCSNGGMIGYPHVGYNVGGIAGRQTGYLRDCTNNGTVKGRKDVGGVVGQAEPTIILNANSDTLQQLRKELDVLNGLISKALDHSDASMNTISARLTKMGDCTDMARDSSKQLLDRVGDFVDSNVDSINGLSASIHTLLDHSAPAFDDLKAASATISTLADELEKSLEEFAKASDRSADMMNAAGKAVDALRPASTAMERAAAALQDAAKRLEQAVVIQDEAAVTAALGDMSSAVEAVGGAIQSAGDALQGLRDALGAAGGAMPTDILTQLGSLAESFRSMGTALNRLSSALHTITGNIHIDWKQLRASMSSISDAMGEIKTASKAMDRALGELNTAIKHGEQMSSQLGEALRQFEPVASSASQLGKQLDSAFTCLGDALDRFVAEEPAVFYDLGEPYETASSDLYSSFVGLSDELSALNTEVLSSGETLTADLRAISRQFQVVFDLILRSLTDLRDGVENISLTSAIEDTSDEDIAATKQGKIASSQNTALVEGDRNVGGLVGAMAIEHSLDPEDDILPQPSLNKTYQSKAVLQGSTNYGSVTAKKDCVGGLVGRMDLGAVTSAQNYGSIRSTDGNLVGGIAGYSASTIRNSYAKCTLSGGERVGGIAGEGTSIRDCRAIVTVNDAKEYAGAIAGYLDLENGTMKKNYYVDSGLAGVDGISYGGKAEPMSIESLRAQKGIPDAFVSFSLTLNSEGKTVARIPFPYGANARDLSLPELPAKEDRYGHWPKWEEETLSQDLVLEAEYSPWITVLDSEERSGSRALALIEGKFTEDARLHVTESTVQPPSTLEEKTQAVVWDVSLSGVETGSETHYPVRILTEEEGGGALWQYRNGRWSEVETEKNGHYLTSTMSGDSAVFCVLPAAQPMPFVICIGSGVITVLIFATILILKRKKHGFEDTTTPASEEDGVN